MKKKTTVTNEIDWQKWGPVIRDSLSAFCDVENVTKFLHENYLTLSEYDNDFTSHDLIFEVEDVMEHIIRGTYLELSSEYYNPYKFDNKYPCVDIRIHHDTGMQRTTASMLTPVIHVMLVDADDGDDAYFDISLVLGSQIF